MTNIRVLLSAVFLLSSIITGAQTSEILHDIQRMQVQGRVLYVAAHPDDENTRLISYLTQDKKMDVSYLSLTRGDGGQNLIGTEIGEQLGLVRTHELLAARRIDGGKQFFTRAVDFGYSKTPEETFKFWNKEEVLADVVWVIRQVQPDIIITRFSPEVNPDRPTHGHHTASAMLAFEAFEAAANPNMYPEQLRHVDVWKTKHIYWNTSYWFYGTVEKMDEQVAKAPYKYMKIDVNSNLTLLGKTGSDISAASRSQHKSQGFGNAPLLKPQWEYLESLSGNPAQPNITDQIPLTWKERTESKTLDKLFEKAATEFDVTNPEAVVPILIEARNEIAQLPESKFRTAKLKEVQDLIQRCLGIVMRAHTSADLLTVGENVETNFEWRTASKAVKLKSIKTLGSEYKPQAESNYQSIEFAWQVPDVTSQPYWLRSEHGYGSYKVDDQLECGKPVLDYPFQLSVVMTYENEEIQISIPINHQHTDPVKGEVIQPLVVTPNVMVNLQQEVFVFTTSAPKNVTVEVKSGTAKASGFVELFMLDGWKCEPAFHKYEFAKKGGSKQFTFKVTPPTEQSEVKIKALAKDVSRVYGMGYYRLNYDHIPHAAVFPTAEAKFVRVDLEKVGKKIAYIMGAGDKVPEAIEEMGYTVDQLTVDEVKQTDLSTYQAVALGIRGLNTLENIGDINEKITDYVKSGGTWVMQYNTSHRLKAQPLGPFDIKLSRDRVTEEDATVEVLEPGHAVMTQPNRITDTDFNGWVQERGLYFPDVWPTDIKPILSMRDLNSEPLEGSLLVGSHGKGHVVYTGLSFFRELPAGVPGAYRLMANILSL